MNQEPQDSQDILKMLQQKIGNVELTVHAMMAVLEEENLLDQDRINDKAQEIVEEMQEEVEKKHVDLDTETGLED